LANRKIYKIKPGLTKNGTGELGVDQTGRMGNVDINESKQIPLLKLVFKCALSWAWYGIVEFNVPLDTV